MERRRMLKLGGALGATAIAGAAGGWLLFPPRRSAHLAPARELAQRLHASLGKVQRAAAGVGYDHPARQYHNRGVAGCGLDVDLSTFDRGQRRLINDLFHAALSERGRERVPRQFLINWPGVHILRLLLCGDPASGPWQVVLSGPHLNLRVGGMSPEGAAFGGPLVYGDQRGHGSPGLPGNLYRDQFLAAQAIRDALQPAQREQATLPEAPIQTLIEVQGRDGRFDGVRVGELSAPVQARVRALVDGVLADYPEPDVAEAHACIDGNGGLGALSMAWYERGEDGDTHGQVFRIEGPGTVLYFRGHPHVHAFIHVARDGAVPLGVGELLGPNPETLRGADLARLFERALRERTGADLALYPLESAVGRLRPGPVRSGDVWVAESWQDRAVVVTIRGDQLAAGMKQRVGAVEPTRLYTVATSGYVAGQRAELVGGIRSYAGHGPLRDLLVEHLRRHGFAPAG